MIVVIVAKFNDLGIVVQPLCLICPEIKKKQENPKVDNLTPIAIVAELDKFVVGQTEAKKAIANALRSRWRRQQLALVDQKEITPKNILMIGPTGVGKTELARRLAKMVNAPFVKVEATKFTEVGYVGSSVDKIITDLMAVAIKQVEQLESATLSEDITVKVQNVILEALVPPSNKNWGKVSDVDANTNLRESYRTALMAGELDSKIIEVDDTLLPRKDLHGIPDALLEQIHQIELVMSQMRGRVVTKTKITVKEAKEQIQTVMLRNALSMGNIKSKAIALVEQSGIVFIDEIDKICITGNISGGPSREGVQRDLLPLIEGCVVQTKYGSIKTDHILFIASGAFSLAKPSDMMAELQGRLPIRVQLNELQQRDFVHILKDTETSMLKQYIKLMSAENITLSFTDTAIDTIANMAVELNRNIENLGARRLHAILETILQDITYETTAHSKCVDNCVVICSEYVNEKLSHLVQNEDLSKYVL
jgi:ATP-dependent HslUV protease ATP-binding subunit HslU